MIDRDPTQLPPSFAEEQSLLTNDNHVAPLLNSLVFDYAANIDRLKDRVGIATSVPIVVAPDFRIAQVMWRGGVTGHTTIILDGKFLDILYDYATVIGSPDVFAYEQADESLDFIVPHHNGRIGQRPQMHDRASLDEGGVQRAEQAFDSLLGGVMYHEYGHYFLYNSLDLLRANNLGIFNPQVLFLFVYTPTTEDDADRVAGILAAKAEHDLTYTQEIVDLMAYYSLNQVDDVQYMFYDNVRRDFATQTLPSTPRYSALSTRKATVAAGYRQYQARAQRTGASSGGHDEGDERFGLMGQ